jgi:phosphoglucomutase
MSVIIVPTRAFTDQRPGTAGLRKKVAVFRQPHYLENFVQAVFDAVPALKGARLVVGGDGRFWNREAIQVLLRIAAANGVTHAAVGRGGLLSTPAAALEIPARGAAGGFILSASHNPGGPEGDFGIKFNLANGGQASEKLTALIHARARELHRYKTLEGDETVDLDLLGESQLGPMQVEVFDPVAHWVSTMERLFDFERMRDWLKRDGRIAFDAMHAVTGPYAQALLVERLGAPARSVLNARPAPDFGGLHPDPNPHVAHHLLTLAMGDAAPDLIAASDGDGDRNMILGRGCFVAPSDSLAVLAAHAHRFPGYRDGLAGLARSMPTSRAVDRVAARLGVPLYETPTGWRFFCNLLDAGKVTLCGEESFGTSSSHAREKDGLWAVLCWLNLLALERRPVADIMQAHWAEYGRDYYLRNDWEIADAQKGAEVMAQLGETIKTLAGNRLMGLEVERADQFDYTDPVDGSVSKAQGIRVFMTSGERMVYRLSGTGTSGATLRVYLERHEARVEHQQAAAVDMLADLMQVSAELARIKAITGLESPTAVI